MRTHEVVSPRRPAKSLRDRRLRSALRGGAHSPAVGPVSAAHRASALRGARVNDRLRCREGIQQLLGVGIFGMLQHLFGHPFLDNSALV